MSKSAETGKRAYLEIYIKYIYDTLETDHTILGVQLHPYILEPAALPCWVTCVDEYSRFYDKIGASIHGQVLSRSVRHSFTVTGIVVTKLNNIVDTQGSQ